MRSGTKDLLTGLAAIVALGGMATLLLGYGELADLFERTRRLDVRLDDGGGLRPGSTVTLNGVPVGKVAEVVVDTSRSADLPVFVEVRIDESTRLPATIVAEVRSKLFGGGADLVLRIPPPFDPNTPDLPRTPVPVVEGRSQGLADLLSDSIAPQLAALEEGIVEVREMARTYRRLGENLDELVRPVDPGDPAADDNLRTTVRRTNEALAEARTAISHASAWLDDEQLRQDVRTAVWRAGELFEQTERAVAAYAELAKAVESDADAAVDLLDVRTAEIVRAVVPVAEGASEMLDRLGELARLAAEGDGTVGRLLRDPDLHESLRESARQLERTLRHAALLLEKVREEGLDVSFD